MRSAAQPWQRAAIDCWPLLLCAPASQAAVSFMMRRTTCVPLTWGACSCPTTPCRERRCRWRSCRRRCASHWLQSVCQGPPSAWRCDVCCQAGPAGLARRLCQPASTLGSKEKERAHAAHCEHAAAAATAVVLQVKSQDTERRKGIPWTEEEHRCAAATAAARCPCKLPAFAG